MLHGLGGRRERCSCHRRRLLFLVSAAGKPLVARLWHLQSLHALRHQAYSLGQHTLEGSSSELSRPKLDWLDYRWWGRLLLL